MSSAGRGRPRRETAMASTNQTHANGSNGDRPLRDKIDFRTNVPQRLTLEFDPPTEAREGRFGDQYMYWFGGNKIAWFDPPVHAEIVASGALAGEEIEICKRETKSGNRKTTRWEVVVLNQDYSDAQAEAAAAASLKSQLGEDPFAPWDPAPGRAPMPPMPPATATPAAATPATPKQPAPRQATTTPSANPLAQALILAIDAVEEANQYGHDKHGWDEGLAGDELIVKLAITAFIEGRKAVRP
jgi:hypothetical protein